MSQRELERQLTRIYRQARDDIGRKWYEYFEEGEKRLAAQEKELEFLKAHGTKDEIEQAERELETAKQNFTLKNEYYRDMVKETTRQMADVNQTAAAYVNGQLPSFYAETYNGEMAIESVEMGIKFDMADEATVKRRVMDGDIQLPAKKVNIPKDMRWNTKAINSNVLQGIIQGESMDKIAKRLEPIMDGNRKAAIRNARTLVNGAENQGRQDKYNELGKRGVVLQKQWIATGDERTRDWHLDMDGQRVDTDEKFVDGNGNELEYPGDPSAPPETVYNCRCTMKGVVVGFKKADGEMIRVEGDADVSVLHEKEIIEEQSRREFAKMEKEDAKELRALEKARKEEEERERREWEKAQKKKKADKTNVIHEVVDGENITGEWERRWPEGTTSMQKAYHEVDPMFDFEIQDVVNAQGFDGLPTILYGEDFDKAVAAANNGNGFVAQRTYCGETRQQVAEYAEQLRNGEWYIDCSTGGAQYGQGMYCASDYNGKLTNGIKQEMEHYQGIGERNGRPYNQTETITLDPSAKIMTLPYGQDAFEYTSAKMSNEYIRKEMPNLSGSDRRAAKDLIEARTQAEKNYNDYLDGKISGGELLSMNGELANKRDALFNEHPEVKRLNSESMEATRKYKDPGAMAAAMGYDAINAVGHGKSGSYTVILNRTKVILKGD